ncbi:MAG: hypothetical protein FWC50_16245, partial [Planctomycetaceae bacterium]|nr:hypothetical protein [Planctomycetaceae bacterium]
MNIRLVLKLLGTVCISLGVAMCFSLPWAFPVCGGVWEQEKNGVFGLLASTGICIFLGLVFRWQGRKSQSTLFRKEAIAVVVLSWILVTVLGALPYCLSGTVRETRVEGDNVTRIKMNIYDGMFESQSGFSTTGTTVLSNVEDRTMISKCILFWRGNTHFLGGIGIIVLLVAVLGQKGLGGKTVLRAERGGSPTEGTPASNVQNLAWSLFAIYVMLNILLIVILMFLKLSLFDAMCYAFSALSTGGFSTYNASAGHFITNPQYNGPAIEWVLIVFMFLGGCNFVLFYWCLLGQPMRLLRDVEWQTYLGITIVASAMITVYGVWHHDFDLYGTSDNPVIVNRREAMSPDYAPPSKETPAPLSYAIRTSCFHVVSFMTTTGFVSDEFEKWDAMSVAVLFAVMIVGSCAGSTAGGLKVFRVVLGYKILQTQIEQTYHPSVVRNIWLNKKLIERDTLHDVA